jgi:glycosyltransferase involved in cell wall biosynthesis
MRAVDAGPVRRVWLEVPEESAGCEFGDPGCARYGPMLADFLGPAGAGADVWLYTPTALDMAALLRPRLLVYDMMDDLAAFADGSERIRQCQIDGLRRADLVFTGGRSLYQTAVRVRGSDDTHLFPSGVETVHYARSRDLRGPRSRPVAGYVGVIDERIDLRLVDELAAELDDFDVHLVGPVTKIDPGTLPQRPNLFYPGMQPYELLPYVMANLDVALMPFALNEATRSISPTKTLEYLAAGLPVVSTRVPDVVSDWSEVVELADDAIDFACACRRLLDEPVAVRDRRTAPLRQRHEWDTIVDQMTSLMRAAVGASGRVTA